MRRKNYLMDHGATTIYERWESYLEHEDGTYELQGSLGHVALGSVVEFYYRYILGIEADEAYPGFKHFVLQPNVCDAIESVSGRYESVYGTIESSWEQDAEKEMEIETWYMIVCPFLMN